MIKYLKNLWQRCFGSIGYSRISIEPVDGLSEETIFQPIPEPKPLHCKLHTRFKKSCFNCQESIK
jgi:hypothetical protein